MGRVALLARVVIVAVVCSSVCCKPPNTTVCEYYNHTICKNGSENCQEIETCGPPPEGKRTHCFALWNTTKTQENKLEYKGCWYGQSDCNDQKKCIGKQTNTQLWFCCCEGDYCNKDVTPGEKRVTTTESAETPVIIKPFDSVRVITYTLVPILCICIVVVLFYYMWRRRKAAMLDHMPLPTTEPHNIDIPHATPIVENIELVERRARGRFGEVYRAKDASREYAVKIFQPQELKSWKTELAFYSLAQINSHPNILVFRGIRERGDNLKMELWLITDFHDRGSLYDYLKGNLVSWTELIKLCRTMADGLAFLHEDIPSSRLAGHKPAVAHRDFKSKNVLIKADMSACIADFGLSLRFEQGQNPGDTHGQVGTRRYMAPEVLEGAISFNRDAFLRIDMYAVGLVLWEVLSRCTGADGPIGEYQLPFEELVGLHPTLEEMQTIVVQQKKRPVLKDYWQKNPTLKALCGTIEECWDQDAEARLSAGCVMERIIAMGYAASATNNTNTTGPTSNNTSSSNNPDSPESGVPLQGITNYNCDSSTILLPHGQSIRPALLLETPA